MTNLAQQVVKLSLQKNEKKQTIIIIIIIIMKALKCKPS